jgi:SOS response regulatory protein OraA/RecX
MALRCLTSIEHDQLESARQHWRTVRELDDSKREPRMLAWLRRRGFRFWEAKETLDTLLLQGLEEEDHEDMS